jgi:large repetitive protein
MQKLLLIIALLFSYYCNAQSFVGNTGAIPGSGIKQTCFTNTVSGVGSINSTTYGLSTVCIKITHPQTDELEILLTAPDGTVVPLSIQNGGSGNNYINTCFTATASSSVKFANAPFNGSFLPEGYLGSANNGQNADGTWSLCIQDRTNSGNAGTLAYWSMSFDNNPAPLPPAISSCTTTLPGTSSCSSAAVVCDLNGLCGNTAGSTVQDWAGSGLNSCFSLENNSFIKFEASATTASFTVWVPASTTGPGGGIQMMFFSGTCGSGTVTSYGCYPHIFPYQSTGMPLPTIVSATGLIPGNTYYLMIDGFNNDKCTFTIAANTGINVLDINPAAPVICEGKNVNLTGTGGNGSYAWGPATGLSASTGSTVIASPSTSTNYTVTSTNSLGCALKKNVLVTVNSAPVIVTQPNSAIQKVCQNDPVSPLSVVAIPGSGTIANYQWYISTTASTALGSAIPFANTDTYTASSAGMGTLYFFCKVTNSNGCTTTSNVSGAFITNAKVNTPIASATVQPTCLVPTGTIVVSASVKANFEYSTGGAYQPGTTFTGLVPGTYNVTATNIVSGCISAATPVTINALPASPATPAASVTVQPTCAVPTATIDVVSPTGAAFEYSVGGAYQPATSFTGLTNGTTYNVTVKDISTGCVSSLLPLVVNTMAGAPVKPVVSVITQPDCITPTGTIDITAPTGINIEYSIGGSYQSGTTFSGLIPGNTYIITARDTSTGCISAPENLFLNNNPVLPPVVTDTLQYCENSTAPALSATGTNLLWYTSAVGGTGTSATPVPSTVSVGSKTYYVSQTAGPCESPRAAITVIITASPVAPGVNSPVTYCKNETTSLLSATGTGLLWYTNPTGGTGNSTTPTPSSASTGNTIYYVTQTLNGCESPRSAIAVTVNPIPAAPSVSSAVTYCKSAVTAQLSATGSGLLWYNVATGGTGNTAAPIPSSASAGNTTYYVSQTINGCESPRTLITVTVNPIPAAPSVTSPLVYCQNTVSLALTAVGTNLLWYTTATGGSGSGTAPVPSITAPGNKSYYATQTILGCESPRAMITVTVNATPAAPGIVSPVTYCQFTTTSPLTATGNNLSWYSASSGSGSGSATAPTPSSTTPGNTFYYVSQTVNGCEGPRSAITVTINKDSAAVTTFSYSTDTVCINGINPGPAYALGFTTGGTFSSSAGIAVNPSSGDIKLNASTPGSYLIKYNYNTNGCIRGGNFTTRITIKPAVPTITVFSYSSPVCINDINPLPSLFTGFTMGGTFSSGLGIVVKPQTGEVDLSASLPGSYSITYSLPALGCRLATNNFSFLNIVDTTRPVTKFSYTPGVTCITSSVNPSLIKGTGFTSGGTFSATPAGLSINPVTGAISIGLSTPGTYTIKYAVPKYLCRLADTGTTVLTINAYGTPVTDFSYFSPVCQGDTSATPVTETGFTSGGIYSSSAGLVINPNTGVVDLTLSTIGNYIITYSVAAGDCNPAGSSTATLNILEQPDKPDVTNVAFCGPQQMLLSGSALGTIKWYTEKELLNQVNVGNTLSTFVENTTIYYLTNTVGTCESKAAALTALVNPLPAKPFFGNDTAICSTDKMVLNPGLYNNYLWQDGSTQPVFTANTAGNYKVVVSTNAGCSDSTSINITILDNCDDVYFPNAFSPDGNSLNDKFGPLGNLFILSNYSIRIFNRFGEVVFSSRNPYEKWDGNYRGKPLGNANFLYVASYIYKNKITKTRKGSVLIVR